MGQAATVRSGRLVWIGGGGAATVGGSPEVAAVGQGGLLDLVPHPEFGEGDNRWIYLTYAKATREGFATALGRGRLVEGGSSGPARAGWEELFVMDAPTDSTRHFGLRIVFGSNEYLYMTVGERGDRNRAQDPGDHAGSTLRFAADGTPAGVAAEAAAGREVFAAAATIGESALPSLYSIGHRNPHGIAVHPETGAIWQSEHGPRGGDELKIVREGENYGWPVVSYGTEYSSEEPIGDPPDQHPEVVPPVTYWGPTSIAPAGMTFYSADRFAQWRGDLFIGALAGRHVRRLELDGETVTAQESLLEEAGWRVRDVEEGPQGYLWIITDEASGGLYRLEPAR